MQLTEEEFDQLMSSCGEKSKKQDTGVALSAMSSSNSSGKKGPGSNHSCSSSLKLTCYNCGGKGHKSFECPSPKESHGDNKDNSKLKDKPSLSGGSRTGDLANATIAEECGAWSIMDCADLFNEISTCLSMSSELDSDLDISWAHVPSYLQELMDSSVTSVSSGMPDLQTISDMTEVEPTPTLHSVSDSSSKSSGYVTEATKAESDNGLVDSGVAEFMAATGLVNSNDVDYAATILTNILQKAKCVNLYDSGPTEHLSPYRDQFVTYHDIPLRLFAVANKKDFHMVGTGEMVVEVLNSVDILQLRLTEVLYSPEIGYTLISIGCLDDAGFSTTFGQGWCEIQNSNGEFSLDSHVSSSLKI